MTKKQKLTLVACFLGAALLGFLFSRVRKEADQTVPGTITRTIEPRPFIGQDRKPIADPTTLLTYENAETKDWDIRLHDSFKEQSPNLKDVAITREKSYILVQGTNALFVESVKVLLTNQQGEESSFRALIDSQTGKVLETWDRSITDPMNPKDAFKLKLDPRYQ